MTVYVQNTISATINQIPYVSEAIEVFFTIIDGSTYELNEATIDSLEILYGNANIVNSNIFIALNNSPLALLVNAHIDSNNYTDILYIKPINILNTPNNFVRLTQKLPLGVFTDISLNTIIGQIMAAKADMLNDYYDQYFNVVAQVYSSTYDPQSEYKYNGTVGLLSDSIYSSELFQLLASAATVKLNVYDLELFISKYIYYRLGTVSAVYINDQVPIPGEYWTLGTMGASELGSTTLIAPDNTILAAANIIWTIFNASSFSEQFKIEITNLIIRMSRADIGNIVTFSNLPHPNVSTTGWNLGVEGYSELNSTTILADNINAQFIEIGYTYFDDPRLLYGKCLEFIGQQNYPLNVVGYQKIL